MLVASNAHKGTIPINFILASLSCEQIDVEESKGQAKRQRTQSRSGS